MPNVFYEQGFRFHFFSNEGDPCEPVHVPVAKRGSGDAKLWLYPEVAFAACYGYDARTRRWLRAIVAERREEIEKAWHDHFDSSN